MVCSKSGLKKYREDSLAVLQNVIGVMERMNNETGHTRAVTSYDGYKAFAFTEEGGHRWATANDAYLSMTCQPVGDATWMVPYACALGGRCNDCPPLPTVGLENIIGTAARQCRITYKTNCTAYTCPNHPDKV